MYQSHSIVAVDTGRTAGVAEWRPYPGLPHNLQGHYQDGQLRTWEEDGWEAVHRVIKTLQPDVLVVERLTIQERSRRTKGEVQEAMEQLGALKYWAMHNIHCEFELSAPTDAMNFSTDDKLRRADFWIPGKEHARDACRHLLLALVKRKLGPEPTRLMANA